MNNPAPHQELYVKLSEQDHVDCGELTAYYLLKVKSKASSVIFTMLGIMYLVMALGFAVYAFISRDLLGQLPLILFVFIFGILIVSFNAIRKGVIKNRIKKQLDKTEQRVGESTRAYSFGTDGFSAAYGGEGMSYAYKKNDVVFECEKGLLYIMSDTSVIYLPARFFTPESALNVTSLLHSAPIKRYHSKGIMKLPLVSEQVAPTPAPTEQTEQPAAQESELASVSFGSKQLSAGSAALSMLIGSKRTIVVYILFVALPAIIGAIRYARTGRAPSLRLGIIVSVMMLLSVIVTIIRTAISIKKSTKGNIKLTLTNSFIMRDNIETGEHLEILLTNCKGFLQKRKLLLIRTESGYLFVPKSVSGAEEFKKALESAGINRLK